MTDNVSDNIHFRFPKIIISGSPMNKEFTKNNLQTYIFLRLQSFSVLREFKQEQHISRFEAYCDLIDRAQCQNMKLNRGAIKADLRQGEFIVTYAILAEEWGWTRPSVRRFIDDLEQAGLLAKRQFKTSYILSLPLHVLPDNFADDLTKEETHELPADVPEDLLSSEEDSEEQKSGSQSGTSTGNSTGTSSDKG